MDANKWAVVAECVGDSDGAGLGHEVGDLIEGEPRDLAGLSGGVPGDTAPTEPPSSEPSSRKPAYTPTITTPIRQPCYARTVSPGTTGHRRIRATSAKRRTPASSPTPSGAASDGANSTRPPRPEPHHQQIFSATETAATAA